MRILPTPVSVLRTAAVLVITALMTGCGGGAYFVGDGVGVSIGVPPPNGNGAEVLSVVSSEPAGRNCSSGGSRVDSGLDLNRNGELDAAEISTTRFVCNGSVNQSSVVDTGVAATRAGASVLIQLQPEPGGANCPNGGEKIDAAADTNGNGAIDAAELAATAYRCF